MRHHLFHAYGAPSRPRETFSPAAEPSRRPPPRPEPAADPGRVDELRDLFAALRQAVRMERVVSAAVVGIEPGNRGDAFLILGEREATASGDPLRLKVRLRAGSGASAEALLNRDVVARIRAGLRYGFGRGPRVQADVIEILDVAAEPIEANVRREETLRQIRADRSPHGPSTWCEPQDLRHVVLIASDRGEALGDIQRVLAPYEAVGALDITLVPAIFEGPSAEQSLVGALERAGAACAAREAETIVILARGGGPALAFAPLDALDVARAAVRVPNLVVGVGHAATPATVLDSISTRSVATPTAAAVLVRDLVHAASDRAALALAELDAAAEEYLEIPARVALARADREFEEAVDFCLIEADARLAEVGRCVEAGLMGTIAALSPAGKVPMGGVDLGHELRSINPTIVHAGKIVVLERTPDGACLVTSAAGLWPDAVLKILLPDGAVTVRVEQVTTIPTLN